MSAVMMDPLATLVHARIAELRHEAAGDAAARAVRQGRARRWSWPAGVAAALRDGFSSTAPARVPAESRTTVCCA
jgi:hypothetical protein